MLSAKDTFMATCGLTLLLGIMIPFGLIFIAKLIATIRSLFETKGKKKNEDHPRGP
jgi:hypothetical protein